MLDNLKVGQKILTMVALVGVILITLLVVSLQSFVSLRASLEEVRREGMPNAIVAKDMQMQVVQIQQWLTDISATRGQDGLDDGFDEAARAHARFLEDLARIRASYVREQNADRLAQADQLATRMSEWYAVGQQMARAYIEQGTAAGNRMMGDFDRVSTQLQDALEPLIEDQLAEASREIEQSVAELGRAQILILSGIVVAMAVLALGSVFLGRRVARPLNRMNGAIAQLVAHKDFSVQLPAEGRDEIAEVAHSFNQLLAMLRGVLRELNQDALRLDETARDLNAAMASSSHSSAATSQSAVDMARAVEHMSASLDEMRNHADRALSAVDVAAEHSRSGSQVIGAAIADMQRISDDVLQVSALIGRLGEQTGQISSVVNVIREVAEQTNLLALNAAIEAARAGEQGRGFAVVADEVRKLAERTASATQEIGSTIASIEASAQAALAQMEKAVHEAHAGAGLAADANQSIGAIGEGVDRVASAFHEIAQAIAEQSASGQSISHQVEQVARAAEENDNAVGQTADAARALQRLSTEIRQSIEQFKA